MLKGAAKKPLVLARLRLLWQGAVRRADRDVLCQQGGKPKSWRHALHDCRRWAAFDLIPDPSWEMDVPKGPYCFVFRGLVPKELTMSGLRRQFVLPLTVKLPSSVAGSLISTNRCQGSGPRCPSKGTGYASPGQRAISLRRSMGKGLGLPGLGFGLPTRPRTRRAACVVRKNFHRSRQTAQTKLMG